MQAVVIVKNSGWDR